MNVETWYKNGNFIAVPDFRLCEWISFKADINII